jgi:integrase/recombinase XerD
MKVQEIKFEDNRRRYLLLNNNGLPVLPVMKYLKYLDSTNKSSYTQKTYCYSLKHYFSYLRDRKLDYRQIRLEDLVDFVAWLQSPFESVKVTPLNPVKPRIKEKTVNLTVTAVTNFYDYLYRNEEIKTDMMEKLNKQLFASGKRRYKDLLYHVNKGQ